MHKQVIIILSILFLTSLCYSYEVETDSFTGKKSSMVTRAGSSSFNVTKYGKNSYGFRFGRNYLSSSYNLGTKVEIKFSDGEIITLVGKNDCKFRSVSGGYTSYWVSSYGSLNSSDIEKLQSKYIVNIRIGGLYEDSSKKRNAIKLQNDIKALVMANF